MRVGKSFRKFVLGGIVAASVCAAIPLLWAASRVPDFATVRARHSVSDIVLLDRFGRVLHARRADQRTRRGAWVPVTEVAAPLREALLHAEDRKFESHFGVDLRAVARVLYRRMRFGERQGASTLTMQVAALLDPATRARAAGRGWRKWLQVGYALVLESRWSKAQILEAYLNTVAFRGDVRGIDAASRVFFQRAPHAISPAEAAVLVAMIRAPNARPEMLAARAVKLMGGDAVRGEEANAAALSASGPLPPLRVLALAPHVAVKLAHGAKPGTRIATTLDRDLQRFVQDTLEDRVRGLLSQNVRDAAALVVDNESGEVLAYVGGSGALSSARYVDGVQARRQAGSTLKPFLYGIGFESKWLTPSSLLDDSPVDVPQTLGSYRPENYDQRFRGVVPARMALAASLNIPAVRVLLTVGEQRFVERLQRFGFAGLERPDYYGPSIALGSADVRLWELATAYRALARQGRVSALSLIPGAKIVESSAMEPAAAFLVGDILSDREARATTFGLENALATRVWSAVKTGTSKDMRDNWCVGFTRRYTIAVWVGNFSGSPMWDVSGTAGAAPAWSSIVHYLHRATPSVPPEDPPGVVRVAAGVFLRGTEPSSTFVPAPRTKAAIRYPMNGMILAMDPDIPPAQHRVDLRAVGTTGMRWELDGNLLGSAESRVQLKPQPGAHRLSLVDRSGVEHDSIRFHVRGSVSR